jgi:hypothetical protein
MVSANVDRPRGTEEIAPDLDAANLDGPAFILAVEHVEV